MKTVTAGKFQIAEYCGFARRDDLMSPEWDRYVESLLDCASTDDTEKVVRRDFDSVVRYKRLQENVGASGGFAFGLRWAMQCKYDWLWLTDNDSIPADNALAELLSKAVDDVVALAPKKVTESGQLWIGEGIACVVEKRLDLMDPPLPFYELPDFQCAWSANTGLLLRSTILEMAGYPMAELWSWGEDTELGMRLNKFGRMILVPSSIVIHPNPSLPWPAPVNTLWKYYYRHRNQNFLRLRGLVPPKLSVPLFIWVSFKSCVVACLRFDHKIRRTMIIAVATYHALCGKLGRGPAWIHK